MTTQIPMDINLTDIPFVWSLATSQQQKLFLNSSPLVEPLVSSLTWARKWTKTWDEHDTVTPYKPFPADAPAFDYLHKLFVEEDKFFLEKSRTVMATWWLSLECLHYVMTRQPASCIFWCPDQSRAEKCIKYCKVLYDQQHPDLKNLYPLPRKKSRIDDQAVYRFELGGGSWLEALPGKNPDRIRSEHPTIVAMDEAAFNENGGEAYGNALSTRPVKLVAITSAMPGWFYDMIDCAEPIEL